MVGSGILAVYAVFFLPSFSFGMRIPSLRDI